MPAHIPVVGVHVSKSRLATTASGALNKVDSRKSEKRTGDEPLALKQESPTIHKRRETMSKEKSLIR